MHFVAGRKGLLGILNTMSIKIKNFGQFENDVESPFPSFATTPKRKLEHLE
jgi:hypothetical protein